MNLDIILPLVFVCGDPQLGCHLLKSPVTTIVWLFVFITLLRYWVHYYSLFGFYSGCYCFKVFIDDVLRMLDRIVDQFC